MSTTPITLPGSMGTLRKGTPAKGPLPAVATVVGPPTSTHVVIVYDDLCDDLGPTWAELPLAMVEHVLDDDTGRYHAIRWLQRHSPDGAALVAMWRQIRRRSQLPDYLEALDLDDETLLDDGSLRIAALVLQAVCLHMAKAVTS